MGKWQDQARTGWDEYARMRLRGREKKPNTEEWHGRLPYQLVCGVLLLLVHSTTTYRDEIPGTVQCRRYPGKHVQESGLYIQRYYSIHNMFQDHYMTRVRFRSGKPDGLEKYYGEGTSRCKDSIVIARSRTLHFSSASSRFLVPECPLHMTLRLISACLLRLIGR